MEEKTERDLRSDPNLASSYVSSHTYLERKQATSAQLALVYRVDAYIPVPAAVEVHV